MAKKRMSITADETLKADLARIGEWYLGQGVDVLDQKKGGISLSLVIRQLVTDKLQSLDWREELQAILDTTPPEEVIAKIEALDPPWKKELLPWKIAQPGQEIPWQAVYALIEQPVTPEDIEWARRKLKAGFDDTLTALDLLKLPLEERRKILRERAGEAEGDYRSDQSLTAFEVKYHLLNTSRPVGVRIADGKVIVTLEDGREISNPLSWHKWLEQAAPEQRANVEFHNHSIDWLDLDEGLDIEGMLRGVKPK